MLHITLLTTGCILSQVKRCLIRVNQQTTKGLQHIGSTSRTGKNNWCTIVCSAQRMKRFVHNVSERIKSMRESRHGTVYDLSWDQSCVEVRWLTMENETGSVAFAWESVSAVDTFKRDYFTVDCICLAFETPRGWIEVNEDMKGWGCVPRCRRVISARFPSAGEMVEQGHDSSFSNESFKTVDEIGAEKYARRYLR